jgi:hypothetical protein
VKILFTCNQSLASLAFDVSFYIAAISEELYFTPVNETYHPATTGENLDQHGGSRSLGVLSNPLVGDFLQDRAATDSPSASVASSSVFSRNSEGMHHGSKPIDARHELL